MYRAILIGLTLFVVTGCNPDGICVDDNYCRAGLNQQACDDDFEGSTFEAVAEDEQDRACEARGYSRRISSGLYGR